MSDWGWGSTAPQSAARAGAGERLGRDEGTLRGDQSPADHSDESSGEDGLDAYSQAVLASLSELPPEPHSEPGTAVDVEAEVAARFATAVGATEATTGAPPPLPSALYSLNLVCEGMFGLLDQLEQAWAPLLPLPTTTTPAVAATTVEQAGITACKQLASSALSLAAAITAAAVAIRSMDPDGALVQEARLVVEGALTLRRRLVRRLVAPLDHATLESRMHLSHCIVALAAVPAAEIEPHKHALCSPTKTRPGPVSAAGGAEEQDPVRAASAVAARHLFVASKKASLDDAFRASGVLGCLLEVLGSGVPNTHSAEPIVAGAPAAFDFSACPATASELIYLVGILKNVSNSTSNSEWLGSQGACRLAGSLLLGVLQHCDGHPPPRHLAQLAVQVTGAVRNLALVSKHLPRLATKGVVDSLMSLLPLVQSHEEVVLNTVRVVGKVTMNAACVERFEDHASYTDALMQCLDGGQAVPTATAVRVLFALGNLTGESQALRGYVGASASFFSCVSRVVAVHCSVVAANVSAARAGTLPAPAKASLDVLVKACRLLAHVGMHQVAAEGLLCDADIFRGLLSILKLAAPPVPEALDELTFNALSALLNVAFFAGTEGTPGLHAVCRDLPPVLASLMLDPSADLVVLAAQAAGNLCRSAACRAALAEPESGLTAAAAGLLHHPQRRAAVAGCGLLMNLAQEPCGKVALASTVLEDAGGGPGSPLLEVLVRVVDQAFWGGDLHLSRLAAQALHNFLLGWEAARPGHERLTDEEALSMLHTLGSICSEQEEAKEGEDCVSDRADCLSVCHSLRSQVQHMVEEGKVADHEERYGPSESKE